MTEEPLVNPYSPGECLARLAHVRGAVLRDATIAQALPGSADALQAAIEALLLALESGDGATVEKAHVAAGGYLKQLYAAASKPDLWNGDAARVFASLGFPDPAQIGVAAVDVKTIVATHSQPARQVMTSIAFDHAPGAKAYRLRTTRIIHG